MVLTYGKALAGSEGKNKVTQILWMNCIESSHELSKDDQSPTLKSHNPRDVLLGLVIIESTLCVIAASYR